MSELQSADLILRMAIDVEEAGVMFYRKLARLSHIPAVKEVFLSLAEDEVVHKRDLARIGQSLSMQNQNFSSSINFVEILNRMLDGLKKSMTGSEPMEINSLDLSKALHIGIENERMAVRIYTEIAGLCPSAVQEVFKKILKEEEGHLEKLLKIKESRLA
jgi:rubrerythrin